MATSSINFKTYIPRIISTLVLIPPLLYLTFMGKVWFLALLLTVLTIAIYEFYRITLLAGHRSNLIMVVFFGWVASLLAYFDKLEFIWPAITLFLFSTLLWALIKNERGNSSPIIDWSLSLAGGLYLGITCAHILLLRNLSITNNGERLDIGLKLLLFTLLCTWGSDTGALVVGVLFGRHKMASKISNSKTWEGYFGGLFTGLLIGVGWPMLLCFVRIKEIPQFGGFHWVILGLFIGSFCPIGDLGESMMKRWANVKDSGNLIPGHGGILDRMDSLLWATVIVYYYVHWIVIK